MSSAPRVRHLVKGSGIILGGIVFELLLSFVIKVLMARVLGRVDYGVVSIGIVLAANLSTILLVGLNTGVARYLPRFEDSETKRGIVLSAFALSLPIAIVVAGLIFVFADPIAQVAFRDARVAPVLEVFALAIPFGVLLKLSIGAVRGAQVTLPKVYVRNVIQPLTRFGLIALALYIGFRSLGVAWAYLIAYVVAALAGLYFAVRHTPLLERVRPKAIHRELLSFSLPLGATSITTLVVSGIAIDTFMIAALGTTGDVGDYNVVFPVGKLLTVVFSAFSFLFLPIMSELDAGGARDEMARLYQLLSKWVFLATLPAFVVLLFFPSQIITVTFGAEYAAASLALVALAIGFFVHTVAGPNGEVLKAIGHTRLVMVDNGFAAVVNVALNLVLIPRYSILGAAVGTSIAYVVLNLIYGYQVYRITRIHPFTEALVRPGAAAVGASTGLWLAAELVGPSSLSLLGLLVVFGVAYPVLVLNQGGIEQEEVMLVLSFEERYGIDLGPFKRIGRLVMR